jgi:Ca-activated chloride channel homolog
MTGSFVLDLSPSMTVADLSRRIARRGHASRSTICWEPRTMHASGSIAFAGEAHTVVPLTTDVATIRGLLPPLSPGLMPESGDALGPALEQAGDCCASRAAVTRRSSCSPTESPTRRRLSPRRSAGESGSSGRCRRRRYGGWCAAEGFGKGGFVHDRAGPSDARQTARRPAAADRERRPRAVLVARSASGADCEARGAPCEPARRGQHCRPSSRFPAGETRAIWLLAPILLLALMLARRGWV